MDKNKAIELLKQALEETSHLRTLHYDNEDFELWDSKIQNVIKAGLDPDDYNTYISAYPTSIPIRGIAPESALLDYYQNKISKRETAIKKIIQKYELLGIEEKPSITRELPVRAFISHGKKSVALNKLAQFLHALGIEPLIVKEQPSLDKTVDDKVNYYLSQADFVVILATGDDEFEGKLHPRQNVIHEIGLAQKTHGGKIIYLLEEGAEFPSNIRPKVWESFKQRNMMDAFLGIVRELRAYGMLKVTKFPIEEQT